MTFNPAAQQLPDLTGKTKLEAINILSNYGFQFQTQTRGGYETFANLDGSIIHIRPSGEIVRTGHFSYQLSVISYQYLAVVARGFKYLISFLLSPEQIHTIQEKI